MLLCCLQPTIPILIDSGSSDQAFISQIQFLCFHQKGKDTFSKDLSLIQRLEGDRTKILLGVVCSLGNRVVAK